MRFKLNLSINKEKFGNALPYSYQYELSAYIYHTLAKGNAQYAEWLHQNGFNLEGKQFRLFSFSNLLVDKIKTDKNTNRLLLVSDKAELHISFLPERSTEEFIKGIFSEQVFSIGDKQSKIQFSVQGIEMLPNPIFTGKIHAKTISPICLSAKREDGSIDYFAPDDARAEIALLNNLLNKYKAFYGKSYTGNQHFIFKTLGDVRSKLITIKAGSPQQTKVKAYNCDFLIEADNELLQIAYECGLGEKNSMGFGIMKVLTE